MTRTSGNLLAGPAAAAAGLALSPFAAGVDVPVLMPAAWAS